MRIRNTFGYKLSIATAVNGPLNCARSQQIVTEVHLKLDLFIVDTSRETRLKILNVFVFTVDIGLTFG